MVAGNQPLVAVPLVGERIPGFDAGPGLLEGEGVKPRVDRRITIDFDFARIDAPHRVVFQKMVEIVLFVEGCAPWPARHRREQERRRRVIGGDFVHIAGLE
jgi:hypothetical protein